MASLEPARSANVAHAAQPTDAGRRQPWDGAVQCELCGDRNGPADHDWCPAAETLVCDECCEDLLRGDPRRVMAAAQTATKTATPLELISACTACGRLSRMLVDDDEQDSVMVEEEPGSIH
jgi:hypothetical protein